MSEPSLTAKTQALSDKTQKHGNKRQNLRLDTTTNLAVSNVRIGLETCLQNIRQHVLSRPIGISEHRLVGKCAPNVSSSLRQYNGSTPIRMLRMTHQKTRTIKSGHERMGKGYENYCRYDQGVFVKTTVVANDATLATVYPTFFSRLVLRIATSASAAVLYS